MSKRIALAGGAGGLGRSVADALLQHPELEVTILARSQPNLKNTTPVKIVDYNSVESLTDALQGIDTVISFIVEPLEAQNVSSNNLIQACLNAGVKRFIPSEWAGDVLRHPNEPDLYAPKVPIRQMLATSGLEYTLIGNGLFMDYLLPRGTKKSVKDVVIPVSVEDRKARIPGTGNEPLVITSTDDIGRGVVTLLKQPIGSWKKYSWIIGERTSWNKILQTAEEVTGQKFAVEYVNAETLKKQLEQEQDVMKRFYIEVDLWYLKGLDLVLTEATSDVLAGQTTTSTKQVIEQAVMLSNKL